MEAMAASKLNRFHWHITDTQSFPFVSKSNPKLSKLGAYSRTEVYTHSDISELVTYAAVRGIRIVPEFDAPSHVGEGWQDSGFLVCFNAQPWGRYCLEPPCGQFDPTKPELYDRLESKLQIYTLLLDKLTQKLQKSSLDGVKEKLFIFRTKRFLGTSRVGERFDDT